METGLTNEVRAEAARRLLAVEAEHGVRVHFGAAVYELRPMRLACPENGFLLGSDGTRK